MSWRAKVKSKVWALLETVFPVWANDKSASAVWRSYRSELEEAERKGTREAREALIALIKHCADEFQGEAETIRTRRLLRKARRLDVLIDDIIQDGSNWERDNWGHRYLVGRAYGEIQRLVALAVREAWEFRLKVISTVGTLLIGLLGAAVGLVALLKR